MIRTGLLEPDYNIKFPYETFPWRLEFEKTICHFQCEEHLQKYLDRYRLKPKEYQVSNRDGKSIRSSQKHKTKLRPTTRKSNNRSTSTVRKRKSILDPSGDVISNTKCKK